tara:strand:+ start:373 stop:546 length:174 start_codon:yes stop_codon:yes gene_type:complete
MRQLNYILLTTNLKHKQIKYKEPYIKSNNTLALYTQNKETLLDIDITQLSSTSDEFL